jgi:hypothetical protein
VNHKRNRNMLDIEEDAIYFSEKVLELYKECVLRGDFSEFKNFIDSWCGTQRPPNPKKYKDFEKACENYDWGINFEVVENAQKD